MRIASLVSILLLFASAANADVILAPNSASGPAALFGTNINNTINQSGLSAPYGSGVTNYQSYLGSAPTHNSGPEANVYLTSSGNTGLGNAWTYDFGGLVTLNSVAIVNKDGLFGVQDFRLIDGLTNAVLLDTTLNSQASQPATPFQQFDFASVTTSQILFVPESNYGALSLGIGEIVFAQVVPEPASIAIWSIVGMSVAGFGYRRRKISSHKA